VIVAGGKVVARGVNRVTLLHDPTAHAEIVAIREACAVLGTFQLSGCDVFSSCEPCPMCLGALYWARPDSITFAASRVEAAEAGFDDARIYHEIDLSPAERAIRTVHLPVSDRTRPFRAWAGQQNRVQY
jgi:guanine deaminase